MHLVYVRRTEQGIIMAGRGLVNLTKPVDLGSILIC